MNRRVLFATPYDASLGFTLYSRHCDFEERFMLITLICLAAVAVSGFITSQAMKSLN